MDDIYEKNPWRKSSDWNEKSLQKLRDHIENYQPLGGRKVRQTNILLVGQIGTGKSSFFNTINSIFCGYVTSQACSGSADESLTRNYRRYQVRNKCTGKPLNFRLCDTRGLQGGDRLDIQETFSLLEGNTPVKYKNTIKNEIVSALGNVLASVKRLHFWNTVEHKGFRTVEEVKCLIAMMMFVYAFTLHFFTTKMESDSRVAEDNKAFLIFLHFFAGLVFLFAAGLCTLLVFNKGEMLYKQLSEYNPKKRLGDKIHCVAFVVDASTVDVLSDTFLSKIKSLQSTINQKGLPQVVLLTKIDKVSQPLTKDISCVFHSAAIRESVDKVSQIMRLPRHHVLPIKNYENEIQMDINLNILALSALRQMLHFANDFIRDNLEELEEENGDDNDENITGEMEYFRLQNLS